MYYKIDITINNIILYFILLHSAVISSDKLLTFRNSHAHTYTFAIILLYIYNQSFNKLNWNKNKFITKKIKKYRIKF